MKAFINITELLNGSDLKAKSARAAMKLSIGTGAERVLRLARDMILARILAPEDFGLMAIIIVLLRALEAFAEVGVKQSVIQNKRGAEPEYLNIAWWIQALRGVGLFLTGAFLAPLASHFYDRPELLMLLRISFLAILFRSLMSPRAHVLEREYKFGRAILLVQGSTFLGTITTICLALMLRNVWALVIGYAVEAAILCCLSFVLVPFLPRFKINRECAGELLKFARGMLGLPILTIITLGTDVFVLGKVVSGEQLGIYYLASRLAAIPTFLFSKIVNPVLLPGFAKKQDDRDLLCRLVLQITRGAATFSVPVVTFMASCASGMLALAYGQRYVAASIPCIVLCLCVIARTESQILATTYMAVGQPHLQRRFTSLRAAIIVGLIYPAVVHFGLLGAAVVVALGNFIALFIQVLWSRRVIDLKFSSYIRCFMPGVLLALPVLAAVSLSRLLWADSPIKVFIIGVFVLLAVFLVKILVLSLTKKPNKSKEEAASKLDYLTTIGVKDA